ncbi:MAG: hypothetical protein NVS2B14_21860 [Chamaesiphon sp.]
MAGGYRHCAVTRTEADFAAHIVNTVETDAPAGWILIVDQLNTHQSATLVRLVARCCDLDLNLGKSLAFFNPRPRVLLF